MHFLFNMLSFWFMAPTALLVLGNTGFLSLYLVGTYLSVPSPYKHLAHSTIQEEYSPQPPRVSSTLR